MKPTIELATAIARTAAIKSFLIFTKDASSSFRLAVSRHTGTVDVQLHIPPDIFGVFGGRHRTLMDRFEASGIHRALNFLRRVRLTRYAKNGGKTDAD
jgi:hypothetical protein